MRTRTPCIVALFRLYTSDQMSKTMRKDMMCCEARSPLRYRSSPRSTEANTDGTSSCIKRGQMVGLYRRLGRKHHQRLRTKSLQELGRHFRQSLAT
ncbi:hypothetical protein Moror_12912, partial [Moniliophthora roreri MCA 2997]